MTDRAGRQGRTAQRRRTGLGHLGLLLAAGLAALPLLTTEIAHQDMTSLLEGERAETRWQAYFVPSPAGSIEAAKLAFADPSARNRLPAGAGLRDAKGAVYSMDTAAPSLETPDEARVNRRDKAARVLASSPIAPPKAFSAGSILERQSLLRPGFAAGPEARTAFARPAADADKAVVLAMTFEPKRPGPAPEDTPAGVMTASLQPARPAAPAAALGYAPATPANPAASLFGRILREAPKAFVPPIGRNDHAWAATPLPLSAYSAEEQACLANGIYFEARGESALGQAAVAQVILNRVRNPAYPRTICGVVYQNKSWRNRCQFSFACDGIKDRITNKRAFSRARVVADQVTRGEIWLPEVGSATHYHANYVHPRWAGAMKKVDRIGRHIFYRTFGGGWN